MCKAYLACLLAKEGRKVIILEEHNKIGLPIQCTGIVTHSIENFFKLKNEVIANRLDKVIVASKNSKITVKLHPDIEATLNIMIKSINGDIEK